MDYSDIITGDPSGIQTNKIYVDFDNIVVSKTNDLRIDHFILGNFKAAYGEGLVFASEMNLGEDLQDINGIKDIQVLLLILELLNN